MKSIFQLFVFAVFSTGAFAQSHTDTAVLRQSLDKATAAIRDAFARAMLNVKIAEVAFT
jgi:hypothetical protein